MPRTWGIRVLSLTAAVYLFCFMLFVSKVVAAGKSDGVPLPPPTVAAGWTGGKAANQIGNKAEGSNALLEQQTAELSLQEQKLTLWQKSLEDRAARIDGRSNELEKLISEMTVGTSIYAVFLGLLAAFGLKEARSQADRLLQDFEKLSAAKMTELNDQFQDFKQEVEDQIPSLYGMQKSLDDLLNRIRREIDLAQIWTSAEPYNAMNDQQRQTILVAELTVASLDYFRFVSAGSQKAVAGKIFAVLANFYSARARVNEMKYEQGDLRRSLLYMDRACLLDPDNYRFLSQRAGMVLTSGDGKDAPVTTQQLEDAERDLRKCLELKPTHPSGLFNLAWVVDEQGDPQQATELLGRFIAERENLPPGFRGKRLISAFVNRACARAKSLEKAAGAEQSSMMAAVLADCWEACKEAQSYCETAYFEASLQRNTREGKELYALESLAPGELLKLRSAASTS